MKTKIYVVFALLLFTAVIPLRGDSLAGLFEKQTYEFPQEKVYVHTDRNCYLGGDTIWLRGYVADAVTHQPVSVSKYLYVDLASPSDSTLRVKIKEERGVYSGYVPLPETMAEGQYTLCAYTAFMGSAGEDYYFKKPVDILSAFSTRNTLNTVMSVEEDGKILVECSLTEKETGKPAAYRKFRYVDPSGRERTFENREKVELRIDRPENGCIYVAFDSHAKYIPIAESPLDFDVSFYPEGGWLVEGELCKVGFKAMASDGFGVGVSGEIVDSAGKTVASFMDFHAGIGYVEFTPQPGLTYKAVCADSRGRRKEVPLPCASRQAVALRLERNDSTVTVKVVGNLPEKAGYLIHERGKLLFSGPLDPDNRSVTFRLADFLDGVINAVVFDNDRNPLSERLFFAGGQMRETSLKPNVTACASREKVAVTVRLPEGFGRNGNYSVSVTDGNLTGKSHSSIASSLLLCSELRGHIENPNHYFSGGNDAEKALDALMLTQGWRRYDIPSLLKGRLSYPGSAIEKGQSIVGDLRSKWRGKPEGGATVSLLVPKFRYAGVFATDSLGRFSCQGFDFPENTTFLIQAYNRKGTKIYPNFRIEREKFPDIKPLPVEAGLSIENLSGDDIIANGAERAKYNGMEVTLREIIVTGIRPPQPEDKFEALAFRSFGWKEMEEEKATSVEEVLRSIPGLLLIGKTYSFRGNHVAVYIDQVPQYVPEDNSAITSEASGYSLNNSLPALEVINQVPFELIRRVDFIRPAEAVLFGYKGTSGGVIALTTKRGNELRAESQCDFVSVTPLGYQKKATFYSPSYDTPEAAASTIPDLRPTLYWNPCVGFTDGGLSEFSFYTTDADTPSYEVRIEGLTDEGEIIHGKCSVRKK